MIWSEPSSSCRTRPPQRDESARSERESTRATRSRMANQRLASASGHCRPVSPELRGLLQARPRVRPDDVQASAARDGRFPPPEPRTIQGAGRNGPRNRNRLTRKCERCRGRPGRRRAAALHRLGRKASTTSFPLHHPNGASRTSFRCLGHSSSLGRADQSRLRAQRILIARSRQFPPWLAPSACGPS